MNRIAKAFIAASCAVVTAFGFAACDFGINSPKSAYQVAVENGFTGTEQEWLNSLKGSNGSDGSDLDIEEVYNVAVSNGYGGDFFGVSQGISVCECVREQQYGYDRA